MSTRKRALLAALALVAVAGAATAADKASPHLGRPATAAEIAQGDISIDPSGAGLPPGSGSVGQGAALFVAKCQVCHGPSGQNGPMDRLTGGMGTITSKAPIQTVSSYWPYATTLFDYIRRAMPLTAPRSLTNDEAYALAAYVLSIDGIVPKDAVMDPAALPKVQMPNRNGFISAEPKNFNTLAP
jgi:mono/diheme cytochrome c family protein